MYLLCDDESSDPWDDFNAFFNVTLGYAKKLCRLHISMWHEDPPPILSLWRDQPNGQDNEGRVWPRLTDFSVLIMLPNAVTIRPPGYSDSTATSLFEDSCRAMACMPNIRQFCVAVRDELSFYLSCRCPCEYDEEEAPELDEGPVLDQMPAERGLLFRGFSTTTYGHGKHTMPRARLDFLDSSPFSAEQWPSTEALDTWKESVLGLQLEPDDVIALARKASPYIGLADMGF